MYLPIRLPQFVITFVILASLSACTVSRSQVGDDFSIDPTEFQVDQASYTQILDALGPPASISALPLGFAFLYESIGANEDGLGIKISRVRLAVARARGSFSTAVYLFSHDGVLIGAAIDNREQDLGLGFSIGSKKADAADEAAFLVPSTQHRWGLSALGRLPKTLNAANDLDSGNIGFEQRNVPIDVGQRSLESGYATVETLLQAMKRGTIN